MVGVFGPQVPGRTLRLWPGVVLVAVQWLVWFGGPMIWRDAGPAPVLAGVAAAAGILMWWLFFSRAAWVERLGAIVLIPAAMAATHRFLLHESIATGAMGYLFYFLSLPFLCLAFVVWAVVTRNLGDGVRRAAMAATILLACGAWGLLRTGGFTADMDNDWAWRWTPTAEERLLEESKGELPGPQPAAAAPAAAPPESGAAPKIEESRPALAATDAPAPAGVAGAPRREPEWPGFRGPARDGVVHGTRINTDWSASPPSEMWRRAVGPGWSSFAVDGDFFFTQEQRGEVEVVSCYRVSTGHPVWMHTDKTRFWESNAGAGPRGTPTLNGGRVYSMGGTGILNALDARTGSVIWSRNAGKDAGKEIPTWGFSSSPLVAGGLAVVAAAGRLVAYEADSGKLRWQGPAGGGGYSSPHLLRVGGVTQIGLVHGAGLTSVSPADGSLLWKHSWRGDGIVQPGLSGSGEILVGAGTGMGSDAKIGISAVSVTKKPEGWTVREEWTTNGLKPYFNDFVVHNGYAYGFDGAILSCIDLKDGKRKWKGGRYGQGQMLLLADQDVLLVLGEQGDLALVAAKADRFTELARVAGIEGKTWNHPVLVGDVVLVRNAEEMAAFRLGGNR
jgi:outer membrane protein assembly factor BamB